MKKLLSIALIACMLVSTLATMVVINVSAEAVSKWDGTSASTSLSGNGTKTSPYLIENAADLKKFANMSNGGEKFTGKYIKQTVDIDLANYEWTPIAYDAANTFLGVYDGQGHSITNMKIATNPNGSLSLGLFGYVGSSNGDVSLTADCGIANLSVSGAITVGKNRVGGVVGQINRDNFYSNTYKVYLTNIVSDVDINLEGYTGNGHIIGGVTGYAASAVLENVVNNGDICLISCHTYIPLGGIAGRAEMCAFTNCVNNGDVTAETARSDNMLRVGGLVGQYYKKRNDYQYLTFTNCVNNGNVTATLLATSVRQVFAGGILGAVWDNQSKVTYYDDVDGETWCTYRNYNITFTNCVNTGEIGAYSPNSVADGKPVSGKVTAAGILSTTYRGDGGAADNGGGITFDGCVNVGAINGTEKDRLCGIVSCVYTDWAYTYGIKLINCMTGSAKAYPDISYGSKTVIFSSDPTNYSAISNSQKNAILHTTDPARACTFNTTLAGSLVNWNKSFIAPSNTNINGMPTAANVAVLTGARNTYGAIPYTVPANMIVTDANGNRMTEITKAGNYDVKLVLSGITPYVTDKFALTYTVGYENGYVDPANLTMQFTFGSAKKTVYLASSVGKLNSYSLYGKTEASSVNSTFENILPRQLGQTVTMNLVHDGETILTYEYSLATYATNQLGKTASQLGLTEEKKAQLDDLLVDMLKYGAENQKIKGVSDANLITNVLTDDQRALGTEYSSDGLVNVKKVTDRNTTNVITWSAVSLVLDNTITMRMKFTFADGISSLEGYKFHLQTTGSNLELSVFVQNSQEMYVDITGFAPMEYADEVSVTLISEYGTYASDTLTYSVDSYLVNKSESATYGALVRAITSYGASARAFIG